MPRRTLLKVSGSAALVALAGCTGSSNSGGGGSSSTAKPLVVHDTVVSGDAGLGPGQADCALTNRFYKGQLAIFRVKIVDPSNDNEMTDNDLNGVDVKIENGSGDTVQATYRSPPSDLNGKGKYWIGLWHIPDSFPAGPVKYAIEVSGKDSKPVTFAVPASELTVLEQSIDDVKTSSG